MPPELAKFHDVLAPRWHAAKGPQRMIDTCSALVDLHKGVEGIAKAATPTAAEPRLWRDGTNELDAAVSALAVTCDLRDATAFEPAFERVHNGFHKMLEIAEGGSSAAKPGVP